MKCGTLLSGKSNKTTINFLSVEFAPGISKFLIFSSKLQTKQNSPVFLFLHENIYTVF